MTMGVEVEVGTTISIEELEGAATSTAEELLELE